MIEQLHHVEGFELYYSMGEKRTLVSLAEKKGISVKTAKKWSASFNWAERVIQRDIEVSRRLKSETIKAVLYSKADYRAKIAANLKVAGDLLEKAVKDIKSGLISVNTVDDLAMVMKLFVILTKLDLALIGENTGDEIIYVTVKGED